MARKSLFPEVDQIIARIRSGERQDVVILFVPSHDKKRNALQNQDRWAGEAMKLFADLFGGATSFQALQGIYRTDDGEDLIDTPILVESYVQRKDLEDEANLRTLVDFMKRMGRDTNQASVAIVINDVFHEVKKFKGD